MSGTNHTKVQQKEQIEITLHKDDSHTFETRCFCSRCDRISMLYTLRKVDKAHFQEKYANTCLFDKVEDNGIVKEVHSNECSDTDGTYCSEWKVARNSWQIFIAKADIEAFAWRRYQDAKLNRMNYSIINGEIVTGNKVKSIDRLIRQEVLRLQKSCERIRMDIVHNSYSTADIEYAEVKPFAELKYLIQVKN